MAFPEHGVPGAWRSRSVSLEDCIAFLFIDMPGCLGAMVPVILKSEVQVNPMSVEPGRNATAGTSRLPFEGAM
ncbi:unnamed protein product [Gadus morhua 'NCC']